MNNAVRKLLLQLVCFNILLFHFCALSAQYYFDSTYVKKYYNNSLWSLYQVYNNHSMYISQSFQRDSTINTSLNPIAESLVNIGFSYSNEQRYIALNLYSVPYQPSQRKPQPMAVNLNLVNNEDNKLTELGVNWFTGYYEKNSRNFVPDYNDSMPYTVYNKLNTTRVFFNYINFCNKRKFSYGAAYIGNALQKKSASSFVYYASANYYRMNSDSAFVPREIRDSYEVYGEMNRVGSAYISGGIGYSVTLVLKKIFFTNLTLIGGPGLYYQNYSFVNSTESNSAFNTLLQGDIRYSVGLNFKNFYVISSSFIALNSYNLSKMSITSGHLMNQFSIGLRLNRKGRIF